MGVCSRSVTRGKRAWRTRGGAAGVTESVCVSKEGRGGAERRAMCVWLVPRFTSGPGRQGRQLLRGRGETSETPRRATPSSCGRRGESNLNPGSSARLGTEKPRHKAPCPVYSSIRRGSRNKPFLDFGSNHGKDVEMNLVMSGRQDSADKTWAVAANNAFTARPCWRVLVVCGCAELGGCGEGGGVPGGVWCRGMLGQCWAAISAARPSLTIRYPRG